MDLADFTQIAKIKDSISFATGFVKISLLEVKIF